MRSGKGRRRARLGVGTCPGTEQVGCRVEPGHARGMAPGRRDGGLRRVDRRAGVNHAANRTAVVGAGLAGLIGLAGTEAALPWQMTAACSGSDAAMLAAQVAPIGAKICTNTAIRTIGRNFPSRRRMIPPFPTSPINHAESWELSSGSQGCDDGAANALFLTQPFAGINPSGKMPFISQIARILNNRC